MVKLHPRDNSLSASWRFVVHVCHQLLSVGNVRAIGQGRASELVGGIPAIMSDIRTICSLDQIPAPIILILDGTSG